MNRRRSFCSCACSFALLAVLLLGAPGAEARFGKSSSSKGSGSKSHAASPVGASRPSRPSPPRASAPRSSRVYVSRMGPRYGPGPAPASVSASSEESEDSLHKNFVAGFDVQVVGGGSGMSLHLGLEGERLGFNLRGGGLSLRADDGSGGKDSLGLFSSHLTYAVLVSERSRLRVEAGVASVRAPDATFVGPSLGSSAEYYLFDVLSVEGRVHLTPLPHRQLDAAGGLAFYFFDNLFALRGGMRLLWLDDAGLVDGVVHRDLLAGPYFSLGLAI